VELTLIFHRQNWWRSQSFIELRRGEFIDVPAQRDSLQSMPRCPLRRFQPASFIMVCDPFICFSKETRRGHAGVEKGKRMTAQRSSGCRILLGVMLIEYNNAEIVAPLYSFPFGTIAPESFSARGKS
jgi:hypothetical protein